MTRPAAGAGAPAAGPAAPRAAAASVRTPDFFIVGQPKSGTTALYEMLRAHPQIFMPTGKEPWFLADELHERTPPRPGGTAETLAQYLSLFAEAQPEQRAGEASALYLWSPTAAQRIATLQPDARIIAILREPASLLRSLHLQFVASYVETERDLATALELEPERREGRSVPRNTYWPRALLYSEHVRYVEQLRRYHELFPRENVLVLIYDDFRADNDAAVRSVLRFLAVDDGVSIETREANPTLEVRASRLDGLLRTLSVGGGPAVGVAKSLARATVPAPLRRRLHSSGRQAAYGEPRPVDEQLMLELRRRYRAEVVALSEYLDRDLMKLWGYDGID